MNKTRYLTAIGLLALAGHGLAAVGDQEAARLGKELTPIGAERAGNKDGSIPEWKGGLPKGKHKLGDARVDPFAADKPMFSIDANNVDKYKDKLSDGAVELIRTRKGYRMDVYPTQRSCGYPDSVYTQTRRWPSLPPTARTIWPRRWAAASRSRSPRAAPKPSGIIGYAGRVKEGSSITRPTSSTPMALSTGLPRISG